MRIPIVKSTLLALAAVTAFAAPARAGVILSPTAVVSNSAGTTSGSPIESTINHAGLLTNFTSGVTDFDAYLALNPLHTSLWIPNEWFASFGTLSATLVYDLGASYTIGRLALWNEEFSGVTNISLFSCANALCGAPVALGSFLVADSPFNASYGAQVFDFADATTRYVRAIVIGPNVPNQYNAVSMAEIAFDAIAPTQVPEPASLALFGIGLAYCARSRWQRRRGTI